MVTSPSPRNKRLPEKKMSLWTGMQQRRKSFAHQVGIGSRVTPHMHPL